MLDIDKIGQLIDMMVRHDLIEISLREGDREVSLRRPTPESTNGRPLVVEGVTGPLDAGGVASPDAAGAEEGEEEVRHVEIRSPMVGTFYAAPDPESPPFVQTEAVVHPSTVVCIVEAMKVFNEIKAEVEGTIERSLVKNGQAVEYGQPLFLVRPA